jgi:hypothetical protein
LGANRAIASALAGALPPSGEAPPDVGAGPATGLLPLLGCGDPGAGIPVPPLTRGRIGTSAVGSGSPGFTPPPEPPPEPPAEPPPVPLPIAVLVWAVLLIRYASTLPDVSVAVFSTVPVALASTATTIPNVALPPERKLPDTIHLTVPVAPAAGVVMVQPAGAVADTNLVPAGITSVSVSWLDTSGPLLLTIMP